MLLWLPLLIGLGVILGTSGLILATSRAERRARRGLYRALGLAESTVEFLMQRNRDVIAELTYLRREGEGGLAEGTGAAARRDRKVVLRKPELRPGRPGSGATVEGERPVRPDRDASMPDGQTRH
jgi:hypothetical protein